MLLIKWLYTRPRNSQSDVLTLEPLGCSSAPVYYERCYGANYCLIEHLKASVSLTTVSPCRTELDRRYVIVLWSLDTVRLSYPRTVVIDNTTTSTTRTLRSLYLPKRSNIRGILAYVNPKIQFYITFIYY